MDLVRRDDARRGNRSRIAHRIAYLAAHFAGLSVLAITAVAPTAQAVAVR